MLPADAPHKGRANGACSLNRRLRAVFSIFVRTRATSSCGFAFRTARVQNGSRPDFIRGPFVAHCRPRHPPRSKPKSKVLSVRFQPLVETAVPTASPASRTARASVSRLRGPPLRAESARNKKSSASRPVSRVLYGGAGFPPLRAMTIPLGRLSPAASCDQPGRRPGDGMKAHRLLSPLFGLAPGGACHASRVAA